MFILGIVLALVAIFAGGCGLLFFTQGLVTLNQGGQDYGITVISVIIGIVPGIICGLLSWWAFKAAARKQADADQE